MWLPRITTFYYFMVERAEKAKSLILKYFSNISSIQLRSIDTYKQPIPKPQGRVRDWARCWKYLGRFLVVKAQKMGNTCSFIRREERGKVLEHFINFYIPISKI